MKWVLQYIGRNSSSLHTLIIIMNCEVTQSVTRGAMILVTVTIKIIMMIMNYEYAHKYT